MGETADYDKSATPKDHAASHQSGGGDEVDATGLDHKSVCRASLSGPQDISDKTYTLVALDVADLDRNGDFDTVNHKFVVPAPGGYLLLGQLQWALMVADKRNLVQIKHNGTVISQRNVQTAYGEMMGNATFTIAALAAADEITLIAYHNTGVVENLVGGTIWTQLLIVRLY